MEDVLDNQTSSILKIHTAIMLFPPETNAYWKQQCILYKRCLSTTVVQLICNQQVVGSNPTGSLKAHAAIVPGVMGSTPISPTSRDCSSAGRAMARKG